MIHQSLALLMLWSSMAMGMVPELHPDVRGVQKKFLMTNLTMPNIIPSMKYALKSVPGLADVGVLHGDEDGTRTPSRCLEGSGFFFKLLVLLCLTMSLLWNVL